MELNKISGIWGRVIFPAEFYIMVQIAILGFAVLLNRSKLNPTISRRMVLSKNGSNFFPRPFQRL